MDKYKVIKKYISEFVNPIEVLAGEKVKCIEESDINGDWPNWIFCKTENNEGWIPSQIIEKNGQIGIIKEDYSAIEFNLEVGEILLSDRVLNGWIWGCKEGNLNVKAWAPLNHLKLEI